MLFWYLFPVSLVGLVSGFKYHLFLCHAWLLLCLPIRRELVELWFEVAAAVK